MNKRLKIAFAGTPEIAKIILARIIDEGFSVDLVLTKPDSEQGRGKKLTPTVVKELAIKNNIPVLTPVSLRKDTTCVDEIRKINPDIMVVVAYGLILPKEVLSIPELGCVNIHVSCLPRHRGAAPIQRAILAGDKTSGITIIQMNEGLDTGDILLQQEVKLANNETSQSLHDRLAILGSDMIVEYMKNYDQIIPIPQSEVGVTYAHKIEKAEAKIDWQMDAVTIDRQIRAFNPFPGAFCNFNDEVVKIWQAEIVDSLNPEAMPGDIIAVNKDNIVVQTLKEAIIIKELQLPGKKRISVNDFLNGLGNVNLLNFKFS